MPWGYQNLFYQRRVAVLSVFVEAGGDDSYFQIGVCRGFPFICWQALPFGTDVTAGPRGPASHIHLPNLPKIYSISDEHERHASRAQS